MSVRRLLRPPDAATPTNARAVRGRFLLSIAVAAVSVLSIDATPAPAAAPTKGDVVAAKQKLAGLNEQQSLLVEQYDQARVALTETRARLAEARATAVQAEAEARRAARGLSERASTAYMDRGSQLAVLLGAASFSDFSDRLEFVDRVEQQDADLAAAAEAASQRARWAETQLRNAEVQ